MSTKKYLVRTYGCQMNEHDSERIAGLFEADGMVETDQLDEADVVVLNTCCIRENADNKLYGTLGHLKSLKAERPGLQMVVAGCLAQKDRDLIQARAGHVDVVLGTHNVHRAVDLLHQARVSGPVTEIWEETVLDEAEAFPSALPVRRAQGWSAWVTIQIGCDNSCAFCIVPAVRGREISRPFGELVAEVEALAADGVVEITLLGQNVNSYGRDLTTRLRSLAPSGADAIQAGAGWADDPRASAAPPVRRPVGRGGPDRGHPSGSLHQPAPQGPATRDHRGHGRPIPPSASTCTSPCSRGATRTLAAMHRGYTAERYLERLASARAAIDDLAVTTDLIVGFPGESDRDFDDTLAVVAAAGYDSAYTFIYSPRPGTEAADPDRAVRRPSRGGRALRSAPGGGRAVGAGSASDPDRADRGDRGRRAIQARPGHGQRSHRPEQAGPRTPRGRAAPGRDRGPGPHHRRRRPTT